jgi:predicted nucleic acid-binding protein
LVLVDTSVWLRYLYGTPPFLQELAKLLRAEEVVSHELVYGELLIGDPGGGRTFLTGYFDMYRAPLVPHAEVVELVRNRRLHGRGLSWIDVHLLASAMVGGFQLWTADERFASVARELGAGY